MHERKTDGQDHSADHAAQEAVWVQMYGRARRSGKTAYMEDHVVKPILQGGEPLYVHGGGKLAVLRMDDPCDEWPVYYKSGTLSVWDCDEVLHPVDALKSFWAQGGIDLDPAWEAKLRTYCDELVPYERIYVQTEFAPPSPQNCRIGSCKRHHQCMYNPCRNR